MRRAGRDGAKTWASACFAGKRLVDSVVDRSQVALFSDDELLVEISNFFGAGAETTATTISWAYYFLVRHQDVQRRVQEEIELKVGRDRHVTTEDKGGAPTQSPCHFHIFV